MKMKNKQRQFKIRAYFILNPELKKRSQIGDDQDHKS